MPVPIRIRKTSGAFYLIVPVLLILILLSPAAVCAEQPPEPPQSSDAGVISERTFEGATAELLERKEKKPKIKEEQKPEKPAAPQPETKFFTREIVLQGNRLLSDQDLRPLLAAYEGRDLTLGEAGQLATHIEQAYRQRGYITALAHIPPQKILDQKLIVQVVEGTFGRLHIEGNRWSRESTLRRYWTLNEGTPLQYKELQRSLGRINENPDREAQIVLRPGTETGATDVYLKVKDKRPFHAGFQFDNQGSKTVGRRRYGFNVRHNNWLIPDSTLVSGTVFGKDFGAFYTQYLIPLTSFGTKLMTAFSYSGAAPKREFKGRDVHSWSTIYSLALYQNLWNREHFQSQSSLGLDFKEGHTHDDTGLRKYEKPRVLNTGFNFTLRDPWGGTQAANQFFFGINGMGSFGAGNPFSSRLDAASNFFKYQGTLTRGQALPFRTQALFKLSTQLTPDKLITQDEFYLGGINTVRGYPEGDYLGDEALLFNFEYLIPVFKDKVHAVAFFDEGYGRLRGNSETEIKHRHLMGIGGGLRIRILKYFSLRIEIGHVIGQEPLTESDHTRLHFILDTKI